MKPLSTGRALLYGTLAVGILDGLDALVFFGLRGVPPARIFQAIASGLLGRSAFGGGWTTVVIGVLLHFFIAFAVVAVFLLASRRLAVLRRAPILMGLLYGIAVYLVMNRIVVPLSGAAGTGNPPWPVLLNGVLIHMFGVGLPASLAARAANRYRTD
jgi:uncharacterized membrane protein YagU involved in acid resistance